MLQPSSLSKGDGLLPPSTSSDQLEIARITEDNRCRCDRSASTDRKDRVGGSLCLAPMPPSGGRARNICIWFISCLFFLIILAGGAFLVLFVTLPETKDTVWFPIAGMVLVGIPWVFWFMTCIYRSITPERRGGGDRPPTKAEAVPGGATPTKAAATAAGDSPVASPGGARRVRFGNATPIGAKTDAVDISATSPGGEANADTHATVASSEGSSLNSPENETALAVAIS